jgi:MYXO-CTERM domain-containing protein
MVEVRFYDSASVPTGSALIDDLVVTSSAGSIVVPSAVPEAETWGMMLAGLGLVGFMARRRLA